MAITNITTLAGIDVNNPIQSKTTNGYVTLPGGVIVQWGTATAALTSGGTSSHTFPIPFPNACQTLNFTFNASTIASTSALVYNAKTTTGFTTIRQNNANADTFTTFNWVAVGY